MTKLVCTLEHVEEEMELDLIRHRIVGAIASLDWTNDPSTCPLPTQLASHLGRHGSRAEREHDTRVVFQSMLLDVKIDGKALDQAALNLLSLEITMAIDLDFVSIKVSTNFIDIPKHFSSEFYQSSDRLKKRKENDRKNDIVYFIDANCYSVPSPTTRQALYEAVVSSPRGFSWQGVSLASINYA
uniref:Uncharacterized protein n=1 Tax=Vespula pensylvanica TaxID=30213 RepID=A0A834NF01_VESPE|nr:hypothetical protein H0235_014548 [Vespula pensylvanica]